MVIGECTLKPKTAESKCVTIDVERTFGRKGLKIFPEKCSKIDLLNFID